MFLCYIMIVHAVRNCSVLVLWKSVPLLINYDVICVKTLHLNNFARFKSFGKQIVASDRPQHRLHACQLL